MNNFRSNIATHNENEIYERTVDETIILKRYPFVDYYIVNSRSFDLKNGVFSLRHSYSVTYEPMIVIVNGNKAIDITNYREDGIPEFEKQYEDERYRFYITEGNKVKFNKQAEGKIDISYYSYADHFSMDIKMLRCNYNRDDISPGLDSFTMAIDIKRI